MIPYIDKLIEKLLLNALHKQRKKYITKTINKYIAENQPQPAEIEALRAKLEEEADRVYLIVDRSVLKAMIKRASITFWATVIITLGVTIGLAIGTGGVNLAFLPLLVPIISGLTTWGITLGTTYIPYNQRVLGGMDTVVHTFKKSLNAIKKELPDFDVDLKQSKEDIEAIKLILIKLMDQMDAAKGPVDQDADLKKACQILKKNLTQSDANQIVENNETPSKLNLAAEVQQNKAEIAAIKQTLAGLSQTINEMNKKWEATAQEKPLENDSLVSRKKPASTSKKLFKFHFWHKKSDKKHKKQEEQSRAYLPHRSTY